MITTDTIIIQSSMLGKLSLQPPLLFAAISVNFERLLLRSVGAVRLSHFEGALAAVQNRQNATSAALGSPKTPVWGVTRATAFPAKCQISPV